MTQTIAQQIKWNFETNSILEIKDKNGNRIYYEDSSGYWSKRERDSQGNCICIEYSYGIWVKREFDSQGKLIYWDNSNGLIKDKRPKSCEGKIVEFEGEKFKLVKV